MAEQLWPRQISQQGYIDAQRARRGTLVRQSEREKPRASEWSER